MSKRPTSKEAGPIPTAYITAITLYIIPYSFKGRPEWDAPSVFPYITTRSRGAPRSESEISMIAGGNHTLISHTQWCSHYHPGP